MSPTIDATTKHRVKDAFVANAQARLESLLASAAAESEAADLDQDSAYSIDDIAQSDSAGDLTGLLDQSTLTQPADVLNGIAHDPATGRLFVTGKLWPALYEIRVVPTP